jgi:hypothetical protein
VGRLVSNPAADRVGSLGQSASICEAICSRPEYQIALLLQLTILWAAANTHQLPPALQCPWYAAGVLLCACTEAARKQLSQDFAAATNMGAATVTGQHSAALQGDAEGISTEQRPLAKHYRALVTGLLKQDQVSTGILAFLLRTTIGRWPCACMPGLFVDNITAGWRVCWQ